MDKDNLSEEEKEKYRKELVEKDIEIENLKQNKYKAECQARRLRRYILRIEDEQNQIPIPSKRFLRRLLYTHDVSDISMKELYNLRRLGFLDENDEIDESAVIRMIEENNK